MARLFFTSKEIFFVNDIVKEVVKDIVGQTINYYPISTLKTQVHPIYEEAVQKIFDSPIKLSVLAGWTEQKTVTGVFGAEKSATIEIFVQARDLIDKGFTVYEGDFFTFADQTFEISSFNTVNSIFGQEEYESGYKIMGTAARLGQFDPKNFFPPNKDSAGPYSETQVQTVFEQQRGLPETEIGGATGDFRQMRDRLKDDMAPIALGEGPRVVKVTPDDKVSSFYDDE